MRGNGRITTCSFPSTRPGVLRKGAHDRGGSFFAGGICGLCDRYEQTVRRRHKQGANHQWMIDLHPLFPSPTPLTRDPQPNECLAHTERVCDAYLAHIQRIRSVHISFQSVSDRAGSDRSRSSRIAPLRIAPKRIGLRRFGSPRAGSRRRRRCSGGPTWQPPTSTAPGSQRRHSSFRSSCFGRGPPHSRPPGLPASRTLYHE